MTGAPKIAAQNVIAEVESTGREAYTGAIGFASPARRAGAQRGHQDVRVRRRPGSGSAWAAAWWPTPTRPPRRASARSRRRRCWRRSARSRAGLPRIARQTRHGWCGGARFRPRGPTPRPACSPRCWCVTAWPWPPPRTWRAWAPAWPSSTARPCPADLAERIEHAAAAHPGPGRMRVTYVPGDAEPAAIVVKPVRPAPPARHAGAGHGPRRHRRAQVGRPPPARRAQGATRRPRCRCWWTWTATSWRAGAPTCSPACRAGRWSRRRWTGGSCPAWPGRGCWRCTPTRANSR